VSFCAVDVRGLQLSTQLGSSGVALSNTQAISAQNALNAGGSVAVSREEMTQDDTLQTSLRSDVVDTLDNLSTSTGGLSPIPLQKLQPGTYEVKVRVSKGDFSSEETTTVTVGS